MMRRFLLLLAFMLTLVSRGDSQQVFQIGPYVTGPASATSGNCASYNGTTGKIIQDAGAPCGGSAAVTLLSTLTASSSATLSDSTHITSTYKAYLIVFSNILPATNAVNFKIQYSTDGGSTYLASGYAGGVAGSSYIGVLDLTGSIVAAGSVQATVSNVATNGGISGTVTFTNPNNTGGGNSVSGSIQAATVAGVVSGNNSTTSVINGIQFSFSAGNIASGIIKIYGLS